MDMIGPTRMELLDVQMSLSEATVLLAAATKYFDVDSEIGKELNKARLALSITYGLVRRKRDGD